MNKFESSNNNIINNFCSRNLINIIDNNLPSHYDIFHKSFSLLDYFFVRDMQKVEKSQQFWLPNSISKHAFIILEYEISNTQINNYIIYFRNFNNIVLDNILSDASSIDLGEIVSTSDVNVQLELINNSLIYLLNEHAPFVSKIKSSRDKYPFLKSHLLRTAKVNRDFAYRAYCEDSNDHNWRIYCKYRNAVTKIIRKLKTKYGIKIFKNANSKKIWSILKSNGISSKDNNTQYNFSADDLNNFFVDKCHNSTSIDNTILEADNSFYFDNIDLHELRSAISSISSNAVGVDGIPISFIKLVFPVFGKYFLHLFNTILTTSEFPFE